MNRLLFPTTISIPSYDIGNWVGLRTYQHPLDIGDVPLFYAAVSNLYRVYSFLCHVCFYMTIIAMFMDIYQHLEDWDHMLDMAMAFTVFVCESCTLNLFQVAIY